jgi:hypothetical protein
MRIIVAFAALALSGIAHAALPDQITEEWGTGQPFTHLAETTCSIELEVRGAVVTGTVHEHIAYPAHGDPAQPPLSARWDVALPDDAIVTGVTWRRDGGPVQRAVAVPARAPTQTVSDPALLGADPLRVSVSDDLAELESMPIYVGHAIDVTTTWSAIATITGGQLHFVLPGRSADGQLVQCHGTVHAAAMPGANLDAIAVDGDDAPGGRRTFELWRHDVAFAVRYAFGRTAPIVWSQAEALGDGSTAELVTVIAPPRTELFAPRRVLFVIDHSRSMALVGAEPVRKVVHALVDALPPQTPVDAIAFDRTATRVLGDWQPLDRPRRAAIDAAIADDARKNGSDLAAAMTLAAKALADDAPGETLIVAITDGALDDDRAIAALAAVPAAKRRQLEVHAIVLAPGAFGADRWQASALAAAYGGSVHALHVRSLDAALADASTWLRPAWLDPTLAGVDGAIPAELDGGTGFVVQRIARGAHALRLRVRERADAAAPVIEAAVAPVVPGTAAALVLAHASDEAIAGSARAIAGRHHPFAYGGAELVVLSAEGKLAATRAAGIAAGGAFVRMRAIGDEMSARLVGAPCLVVGTTVQLAPALPRETLSRLFKYELRPAAQVCYERALGLDPKLAGGVMLTLDIARGEIEHAETTSLGAAQFDACLRDAVYALQPPLPDPDVNADEQVHVRYPLAFERSEDHPIVVLGDADSSSPIDIDAIQRATTPAVTQPPRMQPIHVDPTTPLGNLPKQP